MRMLICIIAWCILFVLCAPLAVLVLLLFPLLWLVSLPLRLLGMTVEAALALLRALLFLPGRLLELGSRRRTG